MTQPENPYGGNSENTPNNAQSGAPAEQTQPAMTDSQNSTESTQQYDQQPAQEPYGQESTDSATQQTTQMPYGQNQYAQQPQQPQYGQNGQEAYGQQQYAQAPYGQQPYDQQPQYGQQYQQYQGAGQGGQYPPQQFPPQQQYPPEAPTDKYNTLAIVGLILSFLMPLVGLIVSIVAMVKINKHGGSKTSKNLSLAGTIVGGIFTAISVVLVIIALVVGVNSVNDYKNEQPSRSPSTSISPSKSPSDDSSSLEDDLDDDLDDLDIEGQLSKGATLEDMLKNPQVKQELEKQMGNMPDGMTADITAQGNTLVMTINMDSTYASTVDSTRSVYDNLAQEMADELNSSGSSTKYSVRLIITSEGKTLYDKTATSSSTN